MSNSTASKRQTNMYNYKYLHRGIFFDDLQREAEFQKEYALNMKQRRKEMADKILSLIACFEQKFSMDEVLLKIMKSEIFHTWEVKQKYAKDIAPAMIQMANCMRAHGYQEELKIWIDTVYAKFSYLYKG